MNQTPLIYLDTSDYSRFADCIGGREDKIANECLQLLRKLKKDGKIKIAYSMGVISELLQYTGGGRELTLRKAQVIDELCGDLTFLYPSEIIKHQITEAARTLKINLKGNNVRPRPLSVMNEWNPPLIKLFDNMRQDLKAEIEKSIDDLPGLTSSQKQQAKVVFWKIDLEKEFRSRPDVFNKLSGDYPFSRDLIEKYFPRFLQGKMSEGEFGRLMFGDMLKPTKFVLWYFEKLEVDREFIPSWMRDFGEQILKMATYAVETLSPMNFDRKLNDAEIRKALSDIGEKVTAKLAVKTFEGKEFRPCISDLSEEDLRLLCKETQFSKLLSAIIPDYIASIVTPEKHARIPLKSDGGDIMHAIYIPHCDIWRGDTKFSNLLTKNMPHLSEKVVSNLKLLPDKVDRLISK